MHKSLNKNILKKKQSQELVHFITTHGAWKELEPTLSTELTCPDCGKSDFYVSVISELDARKVWICANAHCLTSTATTSENHQSIQAPMRRAILWPLFCEIMGIGDLNHEVQFEKVEQSKGKIAYAAQFAAKPCHILFMQGTPGSGKTYLALAICELFTRRSTSCFFTTQTKMASDWVESFDSHSGYTNKVTNVDLLVVDDFGMSDASPAFMKFFLDLVNSRMQWSMRGTVITTNLTQPTFNKFCGSALSDRIASGQKFVFDEETRRTKTPL